MLQAALLLGDQLQQLHRAATQHAPDDLDHQQAEQVERHGDDPGQPQPEREPEERRHDPRSPEQCSPAQQPGFALGPAQEAFGIGRGPFRQPPAGDEVVAQIDPRRQFADGRLPFGRHGWRGRREQPIAQRRLAERGAAGVEQVEERRLPEDVEVGGVGMLRRGPVGAPQRQRRPIAPPPRHRLAIDRRELQRPPPRLSEQNVVAHQHQEGNQHEHTRADQRPPPRPQPPPDEDRARQEGQQAHVRHAIPAYLEFGPFPREPCLSLGMDRFRCPLVPCHRPINLS